MDTKKKELLGNFYREGKIDTQETIETNDHDFGSAGVGTVIPHSLYDVGKNKGFVSFPAIRQCNSSWFAHFDSDKIICHHRDVEIGLEGMGGFWSPEPARFRRLLACFSGVNLCTREVHAASSPPEAEQDATVFRASGSLLPCILQRLGSAVLMPTLSELVSNSAIEPKSSKRKW